MNIKDMIRCPVCFGSGRKIIGMDLHDPAFGERPVTSDCPMCLTKGMVSEEHVRNMGRDHGNVVPDRVVSSSRD